MSFIHFSPIGYTVMVLDDKFPDTHLTKGVTIANQEANNCLKKAHHFGCRTIQNPLQEAYSAHQTKKLI
jgi:hypothetical protein